MFKNLVIYRICPGWASDLATCEEQAKTNRFYECTPSQLRSMGWSEPRGEDHGALIESVGGQWLMSITIEKKVIPAAVIKRKVEERLKKLKAESGRVASKREKREFKEAVIAELAPKAFAKQSRFWVWIDVSRDLVAIDVGSQSKADDISTLLIESFPGLSLRLLETNSTPSASMSAWLKEREAPAGFSIDRDCELKAGGEGAAAVRYSRHGLDNEEVRSHLDHGKVPTSLAMTWDDKVSFVLTGTMHLKKLDFLDVEFDRKKDDEDPFDANAAIATGRLAALFPELLEALGGEHVKEAVEEEELVEA